MVDFLSKWFCDEKKSHQLIRTTTAQTNLDRKFKIYIALNINEVWSCLCVGIQHAFHSVIYSSFQFPRQFHFSNMVRVERTSSLCVDLFIAIRFPKLVYISYSKERRTNQCENQKSRTYALCQPIPVLFNIPHSSTHYLVLTPTNISPNDLVDYITYINFRAYV